MLTRVRGVRARQWILAGCTGFALIYGQAQAQGTGRVDIDIQAQGLSSALIQFGRQTGVALVFTPEAVQSARAPAVKGQLEPEKALAMLLADSGMTARRASNGAIVIAQAPPARAAPAERQAPEPETPPPIAMEEVAITGSRIQRTGMSTPTPVTALTMTELQSMAPGTIMDALGQLPQFGNNNTAVGFDDGVTGPAGASNLNLRGIGPNRTLVLLNGRRVVPSTRRGWVDVSLFPEALVERVEMVTGGASAAYGSDAVSGVANFILNTQLTGIRANFQASTTSRNDNDGYEVSLLGGTPIGERMHLVLGAEHFRSDGIQGYDGRDWYQSWGNVPNNDPNGPRQLILPNVRSRTYTYGGLITTTSLAGIQFLPGGVPAPFVAGQYVNANTQVGGSGEDDGRVNTWIIPDQERTSGFGYLTFNLNDSVSLFGQALYGNSTTAFSAVPSAVQYANTATIFRDNAFLPEEIRTRMVNENIPSFRLARLASKDDLGAALVTNDSEMISITTGFEAKLAGSWRLNGYYQYGRTNEVRSWDNVVRLDRMYKAIDSVVGPNGQIMCRSTITHPNDGCVPLNLFGDGSPSQAAKEWLWSLSYADQVVTQHFADVTLQGDLFQNWAGTVSVATGVSYRKDAFDQVAGPSDLAGLTVGPGAAEGYQGLPSGVVGGGIFERANPSTVAGGYDVKEAFGEIIMPLLSDAPFARLLESSLAFRFADYEGSGGVWAWKAGLDWQIVPDLRLRATRSRDVRAGNLSERFDTTGRGGNVERDWWVAGNPGYVVTQIEGGNPNLDPEEADTLTFGFVLQPSWLGNFALSADAYDIKINGAVSQLGVQNILDQCYAGALGLCDLITRSEDTGLIEQVRNVFLNVAEARVRGLDIEASYATPLSLFGKNERLALRAFANHIIEHSTTNFGAPKVDRAGQTGRYVAAPKWRATLGANYSIGKFGAFLQQRYISSGKRDVLDIEGVTIDDNTVDAAWYTNLRLSYDMDSFGGSMELYGNVTNLFDRDPSRAATANPYSTVHTNEELFDPLGRRYSIGLRLTY